jgi:predicted Zn-dependent protease
MSTTSRAEKTAEAKALAIAQRQKAAREELVRVFARSEFKFNEPIAKIVAVNVYGDTYRVNFYTEGNPSEAGVIVTHRILDSKFIHRKVELPSQIVSN